MLRRVSQLAAILLVSSYLSTNGQGLRKVEVSGCGEQAATEAHRQLLATQTGRTLHNWGKTYWFTPAAVVEAYSYDDIIEVVKDISRFPSPVRALGNIHTVTNITINTKGTVILMRHLAGIVGMGHDEIWACDTVTAQAGTTTLELANWLGEKGLEHSFQAEIGDATIGSIVSSMTKDSGVWANGDRSRVGSFYKDIIGVKYIDHEGNYIMLTDKDSPEQLAAFKCSEGTLGIVVEVTIKVYPQRLINQHVYVSSTSVMINDIHNLVNENRVSWMLLQPDLVQIETREFAPPGAQSTDFRCRLLHDLKQPAFQQGRAIPPLELNQLFPMGIHATCPRRTQMVHYSEPGNNDARQDFSWYEFPFDRFQEIVPAFVHLMKDFAARNNGWQITGAGVYFVERIPGKPNGWFSMHGKGFDYKGLSFNMDAIYHDPHDERWLAFTREYNQFALAHGGRFTLSQTRELTPEIYLAAPGNVRLKQAPNKRFTQEVLERYCE